MTASMVSDNLTEMLAYVVTTNGSPRGLGTKVVQNVRTRLGMTEKRTNETMIRMDT